MKTKLSPQPKWTTPHEPTFIDATHLRHVLPDGTVKMEPLIDQYGDKYSVPTEATIGVKGDDGLWYWLDDENKLAAAHAALAEKREVAAAVKVAVVNAPEHAAKPAAPVATAPVTATPKA